MLRTLSGECMAWRLAALSRSAQLDGNRRIPQQQMMNLGVHNGTDAAGRSRHNGSARRTICFECAHMLVIIGVCITIATFVTMLRLRAPGKVSPAHLGWMSEQWLTEHRAAQQP